jgi:hypothetical protein
MIINSIPIVRDFNLWWETRATRSQFEELISVFANFKSIPTSALSQKAVHFIERYQESKELKREVAKLERVYFTFLKFSKLPLPTTYRTRENQELVGKFSKLGISSQFLYAHPEFLTKAREKFWNYYFPFVEIPVRMVGNELYLPVEVKENSGRYQFESWSNLQKLNLDNFRITYKGFAVGHPDQSLCLVPLKEVDSQGKYALQFVTSCPSGKRLPSSLDFKDSGHSFTQIIIPKRKGAKSEVYSVGFYPRKIDDFGLQFFKKVPGVYRNHDSNVSRIEAGQVVPIVKQYLLENDQATNPCLLSLLMHMNAICSAHRAHGLSCSPIAIEDVEKAMLERNEPELDRILIELTEIRKRIASGKIQVPIKPMSRREKAEVMKRRFENAQGKHSYHMLGANCTAASFREEAFAVAFLDASLDKDKATKVYASQIDIRDHQFGIFDRIRNILERVFLHFFAALPLTGIFLGTGLTHPDTPKNSSKGIVPSVLSETAFATHQLLVAPFAERPLFPAGELLAYNTPVIHPPSFFSRLKYLWRRSLLFIGEA